MPTATNAKTKDIVAELLGKMVAADDGVDGASEALAKDAATKGLGGHVAPPHVTPPAAPVGPPPVTQVLRPNGEWYFVRKMRGEHDDVTVLRKVRDNKLAMLLYGAPGCGKTALFEAAFADDGFEYLPGSGDTEVSDFVGGYVPLPGGGFLWVDGPLIRAMEQGLAFLIDEVSLIDSKVMAVVYSVMDGRGTLRVTANPDRGEIISQQGFAVYGACNPNAPGSRMSEALISRFQVHAEVGVDFGLMRKMGVPTKLVTAVQNMKKKFDEGSISYYPAIREMLAYKAVAELFGEMTALANLVAQAPEIDRPQIADMLSRSFGDQVKALEIK